MLPLPKPEPLVPTEFWYEITRTLIARYNVVAPEDVGIPPVLSVWLLLPSSVCKVRMVSVTHAPASVSPAGHQFRKNCWLPQKPSSGRRLRRGQRFFRNWGLESGNEAGEWGRDEIRNLTGELTWSLGGFRPGSATGTFKVGSRTNQYGADYQTGPDGYSVMFDASNDFQTGPQNVPQHVWQPICLYLGRPA